MDLPAHGWEGEVRKIPAILILPYYRRWWLRWRRTFIIRGRVQCLALKGSLAEIDPNLLERARRLLAAKLPAPRELEPTCPSPPCTEGDCIVIERVCGEPINEIGGNAGAPAAPAGYMHPDAADPVTNPYNAGRPFAGLVTVEKNYGDMTGVDYLEVEYLDRWAAGMSPASG